MIKESVREEFDQDLENGTTLVDFYSKTCGPCKMLAVILKSVDKTIPEGAKIVKVSFEENPDLVEKYDVAGYPTLIAFKEGQEVSRKAGIQQQPVIEKMIKEAM